MRKDARNKSEDQVERLTSAAIDVENGEQTEARKKLETKVKKQIRTGIIEEAEYR